MLVCFVTYHALEDDRRNVWGLKFSWSNFPSLSSHVRNFGMDGLTDSTREMKGTGKERTH